MGRARPTHERANGAGGGGGVHVHARRKQANTAGAQGKKGWQRNGGSGERRSLPSGQRE
jgi:hypothetical protein